MTEDSMVGGELDRGPFLTMATPVGGDQIFWAVKRAFDLCVCVLALPVVVATGFVILLLNPIWNPGSLIFRQVRMGLDQRPFTILKFRTMAAVDIIQRGANDPLEDHRVTPLGRLLRRLRLDELPQIVNVLRGDMSLIGPRPDYLDHAVVFLETIPAYRLRHVVRPGLSGYAQVKLGYAEGVELAAEKVRFDLFYIRNASWRLELAIMARTFGVLASGFGAR